MRKWGKGEEISGLLGTKVYVAPEHVVAGHGGSTGRSLQEYRVEEKSAEGHDEVRRWVASG